MADALVSVLTPSLNQVRYLPDCLESVATQTYDVIEQVIWDGGSTDGSADVLRKARGRTRWVSERDKGQSDALNKAFELSSGEIIGWLNADDGYADRRAVEWAVEQFDRYPNTDVVFGHTLLINEDNTVLQVRVTPPFSPRALRTVNYIVQPGIFFRRAALERLETFVRPDLDYVMDRDLLLRLVPQARFRRLRRILAFDRHQRERKLLKNPYAKERRVFEAELGRPLLGSTLLATSVRMWIRFGATAAAARLPAVLDPTLDFRYPRLSTRLAWQVAYPRQLLPFGEIGTNA